MNIKRIVKIIIDILMYALFLYLLSYRPGDGLQIHGIFGILLFVLFIVHHVLNINWYKAIPKGKYSFSRKIFLIIDFAFLFMMILMAISSAAMSNMIFVQSPFPMTSWGMKIHLGSTAWGFLLMILHLGLHTHGLINKIERKFLEKNKKILFSIILILIALIGIFAFATSGIPGRLLFKHSSSSLIYTYEIILQYVFSTLGACVIVHQILKIGKKPRPLCSSAERQPPQANEQM